MQILLSDWLKRMVRKSSHHPATRITNLFDILQDWLEAPGMRDTMLATRLDPAQHLEFSGYLLSLVRDAGLRDPEKLSCQLNALLLGALQEEMRNPGSLAMTHARQAARQLINDTQKSAWPGPKLLAAVTSSVASLALGGWMLMHSEAPQKIAATPTSPRPALHHVTLAPDRLAAIFQRHDRIRSAQCAYPQALMLAADQRAVFMDSVVNVDALNARTTNLEEVSALYDKVECYYPPAAMLL